MCVGGVFPIKKSFSREYWGKIETIGALDPNPGPAQSIGRYGRLPCKTVFPARVPVAPNGFQRILDHSFIRRRS